MWSIATSGDRRGTTHSWEICGRGTTRAEDVQRTPTQSHRSPSMLEHEYYVVSSHEWPVAVYAPALGYEKGPTTPVGSNTTLWPLEECGFGFAYQPICRPSGDTTPCRMTGVTLHSDWGFGRHVWRGICGVQYDSMATGGMRFRVCLLSDRSTEVSVEMHGEFTV